MSQREAYAELDDVRLHYVESGEGPLVVLLHGFPEFWYSWRAQIPALAAAGFRVVAPDMRGYNLSSKPSGVRAYDTDQLAADVRDLIHERGERSALLAGHDWGAAVAWMTAMNHPEVVDRLAILNLPHPRRLPACPAPRSPPAAALLVHVLLSAPVAARARRPRPSLAGPTRWPGAREPAGGIHRRGRRPLRRGLVAAGRPDRDAQLLPRGLPPDAPAGGGRDACRSWRPRWVIFGEGDRHLRHQLAEPYPADVPNLQGVVRIPGASHWVQNDAAEQVNRLLIDFFTRPAARQSAPTAAAGLRRLEGDAIRLCHPLARPCRRTRSGPPARPGAQALSIAEVAMLAREHLARLTPAERRRLVELVRTGRGRPSHLKAPTARSSPRWWPSSNRVCWRDRPPTGSRPYPCLAASCTARANANAPRSGGSSGSRS